MLGRVERLAEVDSTNAEAMRRAQAGETGPLWITAESQTGGKGRSGRSWTSLPGNLQASLLLTLALPQPAAYQLSLVAGIAVFDAITALMRPPPSGLRLKWPNDLLIDGIKAGGILIESSIGPAGLSAVVGIGVNVASRPVVDRPTTSLADHGMAPETQDLLDEIARAMAAWLAVWDDGRGFAAVRDAWLERAHPLGERMSVHAGSENVTGSFKGLDADGALLIEVVGTVRRFTFGDVSLPR